MAHGALLALVIIFIATGGAVFAISELFARRNRDGGLKNRIEGLTGKTGQPVATTTGSHSTWGMQQSDANPATASVTSRPDMMPTLTKMVSASQIGKNLRLEMHRAGMRLRPAEFIGLCIGGAIMLALIWIALTGQIFLTIIMGIVGGFVPFGILRFKQNMRSNKFSNQLPDALTLVASSLRTGYSFMNAVELVCNEMPPPIAEEFAWARGEAQLGVPLETALQRMVERIKSYDLDLVVTSVGIQLQVGGNLAEILDTISETIRERIRIKGEIASLTAEGKLSGIIVFALPLILVLILNVVAPGYFDPLLKYKLGMYIIAFTLVMMVLGGLIIYKMINVDV